jgi:hypothetical protein
VHEIGEGGVPDVETEGRIQTDQLNEIGRAERTRFSRLGGSRKGDKIEEEYDPRGTTPPAQHHACVFRFFWDCQRLKATSIW